MSNRRFARYEIRQVIQRLRWGESDRDVARAQRVGRKTVARVRRQALERGWLDPKTPLPEDRELAEVLSPGADQPVGVERRTLLRADPRLARPGDHREGHPAGAGAQVPLHWQRAHHLPPTRSGRGLKAPRPR